MRLWWAGHVVWFGKT